MQDGPVHEGGAQLVDPLYAGVVEEILNLFGGLVTSRGGGEGGEGKGREGAVLCRQRVTDLRHGGGRDCCEMEQGELMYLDS